MKPAYILYNIRLNGWQGKFAVTSDWRQAVSYDYDEALEKARQWREHDGIVCFPVCLNDLESIDDER